MNSWVQIYCPDWNFSGHMNNGRGALVLMEELAILL